MPSINIFFDENKDLQSFSNYLFNQDKIKQAPHVRDGVLRTFKELADNFNATTNLDKQYDYLKSFINRLYLKHAADLTHIQDTLASMFDNANKEIFEGLSKVMDFNYYENEYNLRLSFLTSSTFNEKGANISILREIGNIGATPFIDIFLHELSHTIFEIKASMLYETHGKLSETAHYFLKELLAPIIIRDQAFDKIRQSEYMRFANTGQQYLFFNINGNEINALEYLDTDFKKQKLEGKSFDEILVDYHKLFMQISPQLEEKRAFFYKLLSDAKMSMNSEKFKEILKESGYCEGIKI